MNPRREDENLIWTASWPFDSELSPQNLVRREYTEEKTFCF